MIDYRKDVKRASYLKQDIAVVQLNQVKNEEGAL